MTTARPLSEDDLHAYVDGFLDAEGLSRVERYLGDHPEAAARVGDWQADRKRLQRAFGGKAQEPLPTSLNIARLAERRLAARWSRRQVAAALLAGICIGATAGWTMRGSDRPTGMTALGMQAAMVQRVYAGDPAPPVEIEASREADLLTWASRRLGRPLVVPDLSRAGYRLLSGRLVATEAGPACTFLYEDGSGERLTVFVRAMHGTDVDSPIRPIKVEDVAGYVWMDGGMAFGVVSGRSSPKLEDVSNRIRHEMGSGA